MATALREFRRERGLSIRKLESLTGVDRGSISKYELGVIEPKRKNAEALAEGLGITTGRLIELIRDHDKAS